MVKIKMPSTRFEVTREALNEMVHEGINSLFNGQLDNDHSSYLAREMSILETASDDWVAYFIIASNMMKDVRNSNPNGIGAGRTTICSSLVAYLLKITSVDPVIYGLSLERFYSNKSIIPIPVFDFEMSSNAKSAALVYLKKEFGDDNVWAPYIGNRYDDNKAPHISAVIVSDSSILNYTSVPAELNHNRNAISIPVGNMNIREIEEAGLIRFNILRSSVLDDIERIASEANILISQIPSPISLTKSELRRIFSRNRLNNITSAFKPDSLEYFSDSFSNYINFNAVCRYLIRDDSNVYNIIDKYINSLLDYNKGLNPNSMFSDILDSTYGEILYQEQVNEIFSRVLNVSIEEADCIRKNIGKRKTEVIRETCKNFVSELIMKGMYLDDINNLWHDMYNSNAISKAHVTGISITQYWLAYVVNKAFSF